MKKFRIRLFGETFDSSSLSALGVEMLGQKKLNELVQDAFILKVFDFDDTHIKLRIMRNLKSPEDLNSLRTPDEFLQLDKWVLFPDLAFISDWGGYFIVLSSCSRVVEEINRKRKKFKCSEISTLIIQSAPDYLDVEISK